jgi:hypothetical protein
MDYQRKRELEVLTALLPHRSEQEILDFVSSWNLVRVNIPAADEHPLIEDRGPERTPLEPAIAQLVSKPTAATKVTYKRTRHIARRQ